MQRCSKPGQRIKKHQYQNEAEVGTEGLLAGFFSAFYIDIWLVGA